MKTTRITQDDLDAAAELMDDDLREQMHREAVDGDWSPQECLERYQTLHQELFGEQFEWR